MKNLFLLPLFCLAVHIEASVLPELKVTPLGNFDVNKTLKLQIEMTTVYDEVVDLNHHGSKSLEVAEALHARYPLAQELTPLKERSYEFIDGVRKKPWKIEIDGHVLGRPIVEVTTPPILAEEAELFGTVLEVFYSLPTHPMKRYGGGHVRARIKKAKVNPRQVANFLRLYYSYFDLINFSFRHEGRSHLLAAPNMEEKNHFDAFVPFLERLTGGERTYGELFQLERGDFNLDSVGGFLSSRKIIFTTDRVAYDKFFDFNLGRLYATYMDPEHESLMFEFRLFNAPLTEREARLHLKFIMALFNVAMNTTQVFERKHQGHVGTWKSNRAFYQEELRELLSLLKLDWEEYSYLLE